MSPAEEGGAPVHGMQAERTALAWQRTGLSVAVAAAVLARLTYEDLGGWAVLTLAACLALCGWVLLDTRRRYRFRARGSASRGVGGWSAAVCASVVVLGTTELVALLLR